MLLTAVPAKAQTLDHVGGGAAGSVTVNDADGTSVTLVGGGNDIWDANDEFDFYHQPQSGDFDVRARVESLENTARWSKAGIMARDGLATDARMTFMRVTPVGPTGGGGDGANDSLFAWRTGIPDEAGPNGGQHEVGNGSAPAYPNAWIRLERVGSVFNGYNSADGLNWALAGSIDSASFQGGALPDSIELGLAVSRHPSGANPTATAEFRDVANVATDAVVITGAPQDATAFNGESASFSVSVAGGSDVMSFQWIRDGVPIPGANGPSLTIGPVSDADTGAAITVEVANTINGSTATSAAAILTVPNAPRLINASSLGNPNGICFIFSEAVDAMTGLDPANYSAGNNDGALTVTGARFGENESTVIVDIAETLTLGVAYEVIVFGVTDTDGNVIEPNPSFGQFVHGSDVDGIFQFRGDEATLPAGATLSGSNASFGPDRISLTEAENSAWGRLDIADLNDGAPVTKFNASFDLVFHGSGCCDGGARPADGMSFNLIVNPPGPGYNAPAEEGFPGASEAFFVGFDTWDNGGGEAPAIDVWVNNSMVARASIQPSGSPVGATENDWREVSMSLSSDSIFNMSFDGNPVFTDLALDDYNPPSGATWVFGARTGGANDNHDIRNIRIGTFGNLGPVTLLQDLAGGSLDLFENDLVNLTVDVDGTPPYDIQWYQDGAPIAGANSLSLIFEASPNDHDGSVFHVEINNKFSGVTSSEVTLNVTADEEAPTLVSANAPGFRTVIVQFSEPILELSVDPFNFLIQGPGMVSVSSATLTADNEVTLGTSDLVGDETYTLVVNGVVDRADAMNPIASNSSIEFLSPFLTRGFLQRDYYGVVPRFQNTGGQPGGRFGGAGQGDFNNVINSGDYPDNPDYSCFSFIPEFNNFDEAESYLMRLSGFYCADETGDHIFYMSSDDYGELWLSSNEDPANAVMIAQEPVWNGRRQWNTNDRRNPGDVNVSAPIALTAGSYYYVEALAKEGGGGDNLAFTVQKPSDGGAPADGSIIGGGNIAVIASGVNSSIQITEEPSDQTVVEGRGAVLSVGVAATTDACIRVGTIQGGPYVQWQVANGGEFRDIPGGNGLTYTTDRLLVSDSGNRYRCQVFLPGARAQSAEATITVEPDNDPPTLLSGTGSATFDQMTLVFDEQLNPDSVLDAFNYQISGGVSIQGAALGADGSSVLLTTTPQAEGTIYTVTVVGIADIAIVPNVILVPQSVEVASFVSGCGGVLAEVWRNMPGGNGEAGLNNLLNDPRYPDSPTETYQIGSFNSREFYPNDANNNYAARMRGFFVPPTTGMWKLYIRSDDASRLYFNPNGADPAGVVQILQEGGCCGGFDRFANDPGAGPYFLEAGNAYALDYIYQEGGGGDFGQVAAGLASDPIPANDSGSIPGIWLGDPAAPPGAVGGITITSQPADQTVFENQTATFSVGATPETPGVPVCYQWQRDGADIPGANGATLDLGVVGLGDDGATVSVTVSVLGAKAQSDVATLTVLPDIDPPGLASASGDATFLGVTVNFDELMTVASTLDPFGYVLIAPDASQIFPIQVLEGADATQVKLVLGQALEGDTIYRVIANGQVDLAGNAIPLNSEVSFRTFVLSCGFNRQEFYFGIGGVTINDLRNSPNFPDNPGESTFGGLLESPTNKADNYGVRISGLLSPIETAVYDFWIAADDHAEMWLSTDANPANAQLIAREPNWAGVREYQGNAGGRRNGAAPENQSLTEFPDGFSLAAGERYYFEALMKEGGGGDNLAVAAAKRGDTPPANGSSPITGAFQMLVAADPAGASVNITSQPSDVVIPVGCESPGTIAVNETFITGDGGFTVSNDGPVEDPWVFAGVVWSEDGTQNAGTPTATRLTSPAYPITSTGNATLSFNHRYDFEYDGTLWDGGAVLVSINGGPFSQLDTFSQNGYVGLIQGNNVLTGLPGFNGQSTGYGAGDHITSVASLGSLSNGDTVQIQFVGAHDEFVEGGTPDWEIASLQIIQGAGGDVVLSVPAAVAALNPEVYLRFNEESGTTAENIGSLGASANGAINGATLGADGPDIESGNTAFGFSASSVTTGSGILNNLGAFSVGVWARPAGAQANRTGLIGANDVIEFGFIDAATIQIWTPGGGSLNVNYPFAAGEWHHIMATGDGANLRVYFDGVEAGVGGGPTGNYGSSGFGLNVGGGGIYDDGAINPNPFNGDLDEAVVYTRALSEEEVLLHVEREGGAGSGPKFTADFEGGLPAGSATHGNAYVDGGILHITDASNSQNGAYVIDDFTGGQTVPGFKATFQVRMGDSACCDGGLRPADGMSFAFGTLPDGTFNPSPRCCGSEDGHGDALIVSFDTWDNGGGDLDAPAIEIIYANESKGIVSFDGIRDGGDSPLTPIPLDGGGNPMNLRTDEFVDVEIVLEDDGTMDVTYNGIKVLSDVDTGYVPQSGRFGFGARTGGANETHWVDNLEIQLGDSSVNVVSFNVGAEGFINGDQSHPLFIQWMKDGVAIPGANDAILNTTATPSDQGSIWSADIYVPGAVASSEGATVIFDQAPDVSVVSPADGSSATVCNDAVLVAAASDVDGTVVQVEFFVEGVGSVGVDSDGGDGWSVTIPSVALAPGVFVITAVATDELGVSCDSAPVIVSITDETPVCEPASGVVNEDGSVNITLVASDDDANLTYMVASGPSKGSVEINGNVATYTPNADVDCDDSFTFKAVDPCGNESEPCLVSVDVVPVNDAPVCSDTAATVCEDASVDIELPATDIDLLGCSTDSHVWTVVDGPANGSVTVSGNVATYQGNQDYNGTDSFTFQVTDAAGAVSGVCTVVVTVEPGNDTPVPSFDVQPQVDLGVNVTGINVLSPNNIGECVVLDASATTDVDTDISELSFDWFVDGVQVGSGIVLADVCLPVGSPEVTLVVNDNDSDTPDCDESSEASTSSIVNVLTGAQAAEELILTINESTLVSRKNKQQFIASAKTASAAFARGSFGAGINKLEALKNKISAQLKDDPEDAAEWCRIILVIIDSIQDPNDCDGCTDGE